MKSRILSGCLAFAVLAFGSAGAFAAVGHVNAAGKAHHAAKHKAKRHHARHHRRAHARATHRAAAVQHAAASATTVPATAPAESRSAAAQEYGTRPGKGCGDKNHQHTGPPGNPSNTSCPPHS